MNLPNENFVLDSCEYTPVYLLENPSATQVRSYVITPSANDEQKPVSDLRRFYETSAGSLENVAHNLEGSPKPRILKKHTGILGNNLKLASFLMPKTELSTPLKKNGTSKKTPTTINRNDVNKQMTITNVSDAAGQHISSIPANDITGQHHVAMININDIAHQHLTCLNNSETLNKPQLAVINVNDITNAQQFATISRNDNVQKLSLINIANPNVLTVNQQHLITLNRNDSLNKEQLALVNLNDKQNIPDSINKQQLTMISINDTNNHLAASRSDMNKQVTKIKLSETMTKPNLVTMNKNDTPNGKTNLLNNVVLQPTTTKVNMLAGTQNTPIINIDRKIVKLNGIPTIKKTQGKMVPKMKPKQIKPTYPSKHTSVQLLKLGETYHSLNQLSDDQMKIVNKALKIFSNPEKSMEPTYDPVTNTQFIYKVVSPKDLTVVGRNKYVLKNKKGVVNNVKRIVKTDEKKELDIKKCMKKEPSQKQVECDVKKNVKKESKPEVEEPPTPEPPAKNQVTRSGRQVKLPKKQMEPEESSPKPKKKNGNIVNCFQCSAEFSSLYRLQRHYEIHPTHIPARIHYNLFHCLLAIIKSGSEEDSTNIFLQQLEQLITKLKAVLPCLLKKIDGKDGKLCTISEDIGRLFDMSPGNYNFNIDALNCIKDKDGYCRHNPPKNNQFSSEVKPSQVWLCKHNADIANTENETEDCARIHSIDKWPRVSKRIWKFKQKKSQKANAKKIRIASESAEAIIELEDLVVCNEQNAMDVPSQPITDNTETEIQERLNIPELTMNEPNADNVENQNIKPKITHPQFHSTHFDIRSSPMKPSSAVFSKFQIDPEKIAKYDVQIIRPLNLDAKENAPQEMETQEVCSTLNLPSLLGMDIQCKDNNIKDMNFDPKEWSLNTSNDEHHDNDNYLKSISLIDSALLQVNDENKDLDRNVNEQLETDENRLLSSQGQSVLNFLESLGNDLAYPETEIRNNTVDFHLDLFSFHNS